MPILDRSVPVGRVMMPIQIQIPIPMMTLLLMKTVVLLVLVCGGGSSQDLPQTFLNIGFLLNDQDVMSRKVISLALQIANVELAKYNYVLNAKTETLEDNSSFYVIRKSCSLLQNGLVAIISLVPEVPSRHISSMCSKFHLPHLVTSCRFPESLDNYPMDIKVSPNCDQYAQIIYQYITHVESWKDMILIHSSDNCILKFEHLLNQFEARFKMRQWVHHDLKKNKQLLGDLSKEKKYKYFLVDIPYWQITDFLIMASVHNMTDPEYSLIFTDWDTNLMNVAAFKINNKVNITTFSIINQETIDTTKDHHDTFDDLMNSIVKEERESRRLDIETRFMSRPAILFDSINILVKGITNLAKSRLITTQPLQCSSNETWVLGPSLINAIMSEEDFHGITGKMIFNEKAQRKTFNLTIMELTEDGFHKSGQWTEDRIELLSRNHEPPPPVVIKIKQPLKVTTINNTPFVFYRDGELEDKNYRPNIEAWDGFCIDLLKEIGRELDMNFSIHLVKDGKFGTEVENETYPNGQPKWNGMIGELISKEADLVVAPMTISYEREKVVDFTTPFMSLGLSILFLRPKKEPPGLFSFLLPLSTTVWVYFISAYILVSFIIFIISHITPYELTPSHYCDDKSQMHNQFNLLNSFWFTVGALVRQGLEFCPNSTSARLVSGFWWFFTLIIISTYTANLAAFLTVERLVLPINNVEDLANQTDIKYGILKGGASEEFFEKALIDTYKRMYTFMRKNPDVMVDSIPRGVSKVLNSHGKYAFLMESAMNDYYVQRDCNLIRVGDMLDSKGYGIGFPAGSPLTVQVSETILKLEKSHIIQSLIHRWWNKMNITDNCEVKDKGGSQPTSLNVYQIGGVFLLLGAGFVVAVLVAIVELYVYYRHKGFHWKMPFCKYLKKELHFAVRFMSSSKKPRKQYISKKKYLETDSSRPNMVSPGISNFLGSRSPRRNETSPMALNRNNMFVDLDSLCLDHSNVFGSSNDTANSFPNTKYLLG